ncbi:MAG TPA: ATP-binding protein [Parafilimonas sp.]|nr:ATP-binding protein [Parafilimonas sp.]
MINKIVAAFFSAIICIAACGQNKSIDSLKQQLSVAKNDTSRVLIFTDLSFTFGFINSDSALLYAAKAIDLAKQIHFVRGEIRGAFCKASVLETNGEMPEALEIGFNALEMAQKANLLLETSMCLTLIGNIFYDLDDYTKAISFYQQATLINEVIKNQPGSEFWKWQTEINFGTVFMLNDQLDSSFAHLHKGFIETLHDDKWHPVFLMFFGQLQFKMGKQDTGLNYLHESIKLFENNNDPYSTSDACRIIATCFKEKNEIDSSIFYARKALLKAQSINYKTSILDASKLLAELYESKDVKQALYFRKVFDTTNDILYGPNKVKSLQKTLSDQEDHQRKNEAERIAYQNRVKQFILLAGLIVFMLIGFILYRNYRRSKKTNELLQQQKEKVESTLSELKSAQAQLIQSEKMASLGELTAGIAHEIQNPLNFVNNFSEVNKEMIDELQTELKSGNVDEAINISNDIKDNEEKINHHGKRADAIVKGMLQHSRRNSGQKEPTDINALCDEYLRLAYQSIRAKDKEFNTEIKTDFDETIGKINIVPQDIGRVLLNLFNNGFYAVNEKFTANRSPLTDNYKPTVSVQTKKLNDKIEIIVSDNGNGIPQNIIDKIFQPFFTTKPTGEGTGLGLSLAYDIITKEHNGTIKVESKKGEGSIFIINVPAI